MPEARDETAPEETAAEETAIEETAVEETLPEVDPAVSRERIDQAVAEVQEMNSDDWSLLAASAVASGASEPVRLECTFAATTEESARDLAEYLQTMAGYAAAAVGPATDFDTWAVRAETGEVAVTESGLTEWVRRLVAAGYANGGAELEGWAVLLG